MRSKAMGFASAQPILQATLPDHRANEENPGANAPGFLFIESANCYCLAGGPKSSGGSSICGMSILMVLGSTVDSAPL
jgi:hypothetical protein